MPSVREAETRCRGSCSCWWPLSPYVHRSLRTRRRRTRPPAPALYDLTKFDIASADADHPGFNIGVGEVESRGLELNLQGTPRPQWNVLVHVEHARPSVVTGASGVVALQAEFLTPGRLLPYVSNRTASVWTSDQVAHGTLAGPGRLLVVCGSDCEPAGDVERGFHFNRHGAWSSGTVAGRAAAR